MYEDEVLTTSLTYETGIGNILVEIAAGLLPQTLERCCATSEVDTCKVFGLCGNLSDQRTAAWQEVHYTIGQSCLLVELHQVIVREQRCGRRLPESHITHQHRRHAEV